MNIAVVGTGIAGLSAAWLLARSGHKVSVYEKAQRAGGHSHTVDVELEGVRHPVDTGFLVHNARTYPNLIALFQTLGVKTCDSEMTFSVTSEADDLEWAGSSIATLFGQKRNLVRPRFWRMLADIQRLHRLAPIILAEARARGDTLGEALARHGFGETLLRWYLLPMGAAIWSTSTRDMLDFPAATFFEFCANHGLMQVTDRPQWRTVVGGSREYVRTMLETLDEVRYGCPVHAIREAGQGVELAHAHGVSRHDQVVLACHSDEARAVLGERHHAARTLLGQIGYTPNRAYLHSDARVLPRRRALWSAWNYRAETGAAGDAPVSVHYLINRLQPLPFKAPVIVSLNPAQAPDQLIARFDYAHPRLDAAAIAAQQALDGVQGQGGVWLAGAWCGYGFHEDGLKAGMRVALALGATVPWQHGLAPIMRPAPSLTEACAA